MGRGCANPHSVRRGKKRLRDNTCMPSEKELLERIRYLEEQNSMLQDKLDMIYAVVAPEYEEEHVGDDQPEPPAFVQIEDPRKQKKLDQGI